MKPGDSVYRMGKHVAHAVRVVTQRHVRTECGRTFYAADVIHNRGRNKPCTMCARAIERKETA